MSQCETQPKQPMTTEELKTVLHQLPSEWAAKLSAHLASLSALPDDVARDVETVRDGLQSRPKVPARLDFREAALTRLATAAARVPGLEAERRAILEEMATLESERDAARQEVASERAAREHLEREREVWRGIESERDALTARVAALEREAKEAESALDEDGAESQESESVADRIRALSEDRQEEKSRRESAEARATAAEKRIRDAADLLTGILKGPDRKDPLELETCVDEAAQRLSAPTPAPGLREAVGPLVESLRGLQPDTTSSLYYARENEQGPEVLDAEGVARLLAAYDAATGGAR